MTDRRVQGVALIVVLAALCFGGWGLYEVGKSHGLQQARLNAPQASSLPAGQAAPSGANPETAAPQAPSEEGFAPQNPQPGSGAGSDMVHATRTGKRYHRAGCRFLSKSDIPMTRQEAEAKGLTPCGVCQP